MTEPVVTVVNRGGRPKLYHSPEAKKAAAAAARRASRLAKKEAQAAAPAILVPKDAPPVHTLIATAVASLSMQESLFVSEVCSGVSLIKAFKKAFPTASDNTAHARSSEYAARPEIAKAIATVKAGLAASVAYGFEAFMNEMNAAIVFAQNTRNATAMVRAVELKGKATGHLSDKPQGGGAAGFTLVIGTGEQLPPLEVADG